MRIRYRLYGKYVLGIVFFDFSCPHVRWSSVSLCTYHVVCRPCREITEKENEKENEKEKEKSEIRMGMFSFHLNDLGALLTLLILQCDW